VGNPSQKQLDAWLREWQKALRLQDWEVKIGLYREKSMGMDASEALNSYHMGLKRSLIQVRDLTDHANDDFPADPEASIVHELLHLHFAPFHARNGLANTFQEQAIEVLAQCLVALKRKGEAMAGKSTSKGKAVIPSGGAKPSGQKMPTEGNVKMAGSKTKGKGKDCK
jgi:hypothetical protein